MTFGNITENNGSVSGNFYSDSKYKHLQSTIAKTNWRLGKYSFRIKPLQNRVCCSRDCDKTFAIKPYLKQKYCSRRCAAHVNNLGRKHSLETRQKISSTIKRFCPPPPRRIVTLLPVQCLNANCKKVFFVPPYMATKRKYCSNYCHMQIIGRNTTSPKASRGKSGIRPDIDDSICFYSTWEANIARVLTLMNINWQYSPKIFDLGKHTYRPDFYLPDSNLFLEVKNYMNDYSRERDRLFRQKYPNIKLEIISKEKYKQLESVFKPLIYKWE